MTDMTSELIGHSQLTTIDQSELSFQLGLSSGGGTILPPAQSPEDRLSTTPSPISSLHEDGVEDFWRQLPSQKTVVVEAGKKQKVPKKRKKKDPNKHQKPVSAYALFFHDTQAAIKGQNPNATFGEVSKIVASMWDSLGEEQKQVYKRKTEAAKKEYLKALTAYKDNQECQATVETTTLVPPTVESSPEQPMNSSPEAHRVEVTSPETICEMTTDVSPSPIDVELVSRSPVALSPQLRCLSSGCENTSIVSKDWNNEYCSNECVVKHCRDVFLVWVASRNSNSGVCEIVLPVLQASEDYIYIKNPAR
uniref:TOX high mobility group box family member 4 n=2 Tax=Rhinopithecus TaxID=542827 RepID=A0A2K6JSA9_RHIBE